MSKKGRGREEAVKLESSHRLFEMQTNVVPLCLEEKVSGCLSFKNPQGSNYLWKIENALKHLCFSSVDCTFPSCKQWVVYFCSGEESPPPSLFSFVSSVFFLSSCTETTGLLDGKPTPMWPNNRTDRDTWAVGQGLLVSLITQVEQGSWKRWYGEIKRKRVNELKRSRSERCERTPAWFRFSSTTLFQLLVWMVLH